MHLRRRRLGRVGAELTSSPFWILRLELMMILWPRSKVTTSATQLGAHEWLMYLRAAVQRWLAVQQPGKADAPTPAAPPHWPLTARAPTDTDGCAAAGPQRPGQPGNSQTYGEMLSKNSGRD